MDYAVLIIIFPLLGLILNGFFGRKWSETAAGWLASLMIGCSFIIAVALTLELFSLDPHDRHVNVEIFRWITVGNLKLDFAFLIDPLSSVMILVVTGISFLIHIYSIGYMHGDPRVRLFFVYMNLFVFFMLVLVLGNSYPVMFIGWEGVGLCSYLLIGFWWSDQAKAEAGMKAFIVNRIGDFGMLIAMFLMFYNLGTLTFEGVFSGAAAQWGNDIGAPTITAITLLLLMGAIGKSAQLPLHVWLPDAMAGPTPVSALIHAATMVTAGVYMIARSNLLFMLAPTSMTVVAVIGALTALFAATIGLKQFDIKKVLAYSTVSQLGYMVMACGVGAFTAGIFHLMTHAFFKALLFLGSGAVIHTMHGALHLVHDHHTDPQDIRNMGGLKKYIPLTYTTFVIACFAIAGIPGLSGFFSKDEILASAYASGNIFAYILGLGAAILTAFYMFRLVYLTFHGEYKGPSGSAVGLQESPGTMTTPLVILAILSIIGGYIGLPLVLGEKINIFHDWMHPVFAEGVSLAHSHPQHLTHAAEWILLAVSVVAAIFGLSIAWSMYIKRKIVAKPDAEQRGIELVLYRKYYVDELYSFSVVKPLIQLSRWAWKIIDDGLIDSVMVLGSAKSVRWIGGGLRQMQTGAVGSYALMIAAGVIVILVFYLVR